MSKAWVYQDAKQIKKRGEAAASWYAAWLDPDGKRRCKSCGAGAEGNMKADDFARIYGACDEYARVPADLPCAPADWWRALLVTAYMTGWRIGELLALRREDVDLKEGTALTRAEDNKGGRDDLIRLHPVVVEHLKAVVSFAPFVFHWPHTQCRLDVEFDRVQAGAGIALQCKRNHQHTDACSYYGFHDMRRAFATLNAPRLTADALQKLMRHKNYATTKRYINLASQLDAAVESLHVPEVLRKAAAD